MPTSSASSGPSSPSPTTQRGGARRPRSPRRREPGQARAHVGGHDERGLAGRPARPAARRRPSGRRRHVVRRARRPAGAARRGRRWRWSCRGTAGRRSRTTATGGSPRRGRRRRARRAASTPMVVVSSSYDGHRAGALAAAGAGHGPDLGPVEPAVGKVGAVAQDPPGGHADQATARSDGSSHFSGGEAMGSGRPDLTDRHISPYPAAMQLGDMANGDAAPYGKPLDGVRILAARADAGAALRHPAAGPARRRRGQGRAPRCAASRAGRRCPAWPTPRAGRSGATFLRNNLNKRSVGIDLKHPTGRDLVPARWRPASTSSPRTSRPGTMDRLGLGYDDVAARHPAVDLPVGVGLREHGRDRRTATGPPTPRSSRRCRASTSTSASRATSPRWSTRSAPSATSARRCSATIGVLAALRHRDRTGEGQHVDVAMLDAMVAMTDLVTNFWSMGIHGQVEDELERSSSTAFGPPTAGSSSRSAASTSSPRWPR